MSTFIITDSTAYLPDEIVKQYNVSILSLNVHLPERDFKEGQGMSNRDYYQFLKITGYSLQPPNLQLVNFWKYLNGFSRMMRPWSSCCLPNCQAPCNLRR